LAKITVDDKIRGIDGSIKTECIHEAIEVVLQFFTMLEGINYLDRVEIAKVTWECKKSWAQGESPFMEDFLIVFWPVPYGEAKGKLELLARRDIAQKEISLFRNEAKPERYHKTIRLKDDTTKTLATALLKAMQIAIQEMISTYREAEVLIGRFNIRLAPLTDGTKIV